MNAYLKLTLPDRTPGSYYRSDYPKDVLYSHFRFKQVTVSFTKANGTATRITDLLARQLLDQGRISQEQKDAYERQVCAEFSKIGDHDTLSPEETYQLIHGFRKLCWGSHVLEQWQAEENGKALRFDPSGGIDQRAKKDELLENCRAVIFGLCDAALYPQFAQDLQKARDQKKEIYLLASRAAGDDLPCAAQLTRLLGDVTGLRILEADPGRLTETIDPEPNLQESIQDGSACLFVYGEEGLLHCRGLLTDGIVYAVPAGFHAQAVTNQLGCSRGCVVYVPKGFDITQWVKLTEQTRISYWQLAKLWEAYGDAVYRLTPEELYRQYPQYFLNIYENGTSCPEAEPAYPIQVSVPPDAASPMEQFDDLREQAVGGYLGSFENVRYVSAYFDENLVPQPICRESGNPQAGILVHGVRIRKARDAQVLPCPKGVTPRQMFAGAGMPGTGLVSNFLFFMTPKLGQLYNDLRKDRPREQADAAAGHLDYMLCYRDGKRVETFPLFRKTCIAKKENGEFLFFNFRLGGGSLNINGHQLRWAKEDVDSESDAIRVYTPYYSLPDRDADRQVYRKPVGECRTNLVILQDRVCCIRKGDVLLPSAGVVVSLDPVTGENLLQALGLQPLEDGYYDPSGLNLAIQLDPPAQVPAEQWAQVRWAYGGGLSLILDGVGLCDGDHMEQWFEEDGWKSPLSRQTQESNLHSLVKHPRTAIGVAKNGDLVILVFSGRTWRSSGADYREMCAIARALHPDIHDLMNVDGGGSAMLGMVTDGNFMELSCPSTSTDSCVGMVRPVNTVLYIPAE